MNFQSVKDDVEKQEYPIASDEPTDVMEFSTQQNEVFTGPLKCLNLLDQFDRKLVDKSLKLHRPNTDAELYD